MIRLPTFVAALLLATCLTSLADNADRPHYTVRFGAELHSGSSIAHVRIRLTHQAQWVRWMLLRTDGRYQNMRASGELEQRDGGWWWQPPESQAWLSYDIDLQSKRANGRYDGYRGDHWMLFRLDDLVPQIRIDMEDGTRSYSTLELSLPDGWSSALPYPRYSSGRFKLDNPDTLFDRPSGWMIAGRNLGVRREHIAGTAFTIASPTGEGFRRMDVLSFLHRNMPTMRALLPDFPDRVLIVGANDPMWRGALSGPDSLFLHSDRPLVSEDGTSTLIHELIHVGMQARGEPDADWLVEGIAEFYALTLLERSGDLPAERVDRAFKSMAEHADYREPLTAGRAHGRITQAAVTELHRIDREIRQASAGRYSLDDVVRQLADDRQPISNERFETLTERFKTTATTAAGGD